MLFLLRPRQTAMPYALPRSRELQDRYNRQMREAYSATLGAAPYLPEAAGADRDPIADLKELAQLHASGVLTDTEFAAAKGKILNPQDDRA